ncbi:hypothetical protein PDE_08575 [Penicillium oxalicum 114-2]|uniref:Uncharacterized protein n=1 Tax=Penicillium oxalicum (strain 114-2 / CGMCC 5302) TaxID=933388 RepID=S8B455_PENO1|nr:hypothetical protein PDE_08575 [Penicillium oxalicum 114-2]
MAVAVKWALNTPWETVVRLVVGPPVPTRQWSLEARETIQGLICVVLDVSRGEEAKRWGGQNTANVGGSHRRLRSMVGGDGFFGTAMVKKGNEKNRKIEKWENGKMDKGKKNKVPRGLWLDQFRWIQPHESPPSWNS